MTTRQHVVPEPAFRKIKDDAKARGREERDAELLERAKTLGYETVDAMFEEMERQRKESGVTTTPRKPTTTQTQPPRRTQPAARTPALPAARPTDQRDLKRNDRLRAQLQKERTDHEAKIAEANRKATREEAKRKTAEEQLAQKDAEMSVREAAILSGVKDVDYAVTLLRREMAGKNEDELKVFNSDKFFTDMREKRPYLFSEQTVAVPVTTAAGGKDGQNPPTPPKPGDEAVTPKPGKSVKDMTRQEFDEHLRANNLTVTT